MPKAISSPKIPPDAPTVPPCSVHSEKVGIRDGNGDQRCAHNAERVALDETPRSPIALQVRADKPERQHVEEKVAET